jgi:hypothetical protein
MRGRIATKRMDIAGIAWLDRLLLLLLHATMLHPRRRPDYTIAIGIR